MIRSTLITALALGSISFTTSQASAGEVVLGGKLAPSCYHIAESRGDPRQGIDICTQALENDALNTHDRAATYINLGVLQARAGAQQSALDSYDRATALDGNIAEAYIDRSSTLIALKDYRGALDSANKGINLGARFPEVVLFNRAVAEEGLGDNLAAYHDLKQAVSLTPGFAEATRELKRFKVSDGTT